MNTFCTCLLGIYVLLVLLKLLILNMLCISLLGVYLLSILSQILYLNMFCISFWGIFFLWFSLLAPPFPFSPFIFYCYLLVYLLLSAGASIVICLCFFSYLFVFLLLSACVSLIFCCLYVGRHTTCTTAVVQFVPQSSYNVYYGCRTLSKSAHSMHY